MQTMDLCWNKDRFISSVSYKFWCMFQPKVVLKQVEYQKTGEALTLKRPGAHSLISKGMIV